MTTIEKLRAALQAAIQAKADAIAEGKPQEEIDKASEKVLATWQKLIDGLQTELDETKEGREVLIKETRPQDRIDFADKKIARLEAELKENIGLLEAEETAVKTEAETRKTANQEAQEAAKKAADKAKTKPRGAIKLDDTNLDDCKKKLEESGLRIQKARDRGKTAPTHSRKVSTVLADSLVRTVSGAVSKELTLEKVGDIDIEALEQAGKHLTAALKSIRKALGGIEDDNATMIKTFQKNYEEIVATVRDKQKQAELKQAA